MKVCGIYNNLITDIIENVALKKPGILVDNISEFEYNSDKVLFLKDSVVVNENDNVSDIAEADKIPILPINSISIPCETKDQANYFAAEEISKLNEEKAKTEFLKALENNNNVPQSWIDFRTQRDVIKALVDSFITDNNLV